MLCIDQPCFLFLEANRVPRKHEKCAFPSCRNSPCQLGVWLEVIHGHCCAFCTENKAHMMFWSTQWNICLQVRLHCLEGFSFYMSTRLGNSLYIQCHEHQHLNFLLMLLLSFCSSRKPLIHKMNIAITVIFQSLCRFNYLLLVFCADLCQTS